MPSGGSIVKIDVRYRKVFLHVVNTVHRAKEKRRPKPALSQRYIKQTSCSKTL